MLKKNIQKKNLQLKLTLHNNWKLSYYPCLMKSEMTGQCLLFVYLFYLLLYNSTTVYFVTIFVNICLKLLIAFSYDIFNFYKPFLRHLWLQLKSKQYKLKTLSRILVQVKV